MSETTSKTPAKKPAATTDSAKKSTDSAPAKTADSGGAKESDSGSGTNSAADSGASAKEDTGGKWAKNAPAGNSEVYYGHFSNVKNDIYRSAWDDIWGGNEGEKNPSGENRKPQKKSASKAAKKKPAPVSLSIDFADLPPKLRDGLAELARAELKKNSRMSYDRWEKTGAVGWRIECRIDP